MIDMREIPTASLRWEVLWEDLLVMEPRASNSINARAPDRLVVHRKGRPGVEEPAALAFQLHSFPGTPQVRCSTDHTLLLFPKALIQGGA